MQAYSIYYEIEGDDVINFVCNMVFQDDAAFCEFLRNESDVKSTELILEWDETQPPKNAFEERYYTG